MIPTSVLIVQPGDAPVATKLHLCEGDTTISYGALIAALAEHGIGSDFQHALIRWQGADLDLFADGNGALNRRATEWARVTVPDAPALYGPAVLFLGRRAWV